MHAGDLLRRIDRRLIPPLGAAVHRLGRGLIRARVPMLAGLAALAVLVGAVWAQRRPSADDPDARRVAHVGVAGDQTVGGYLAASRRELTALVGGSPDDSAYALVSLTAYLAPDRLARVVADVAVWSVYVRVPLPGAATPVAQVDAFRVPADVAAGMRQLALRREGEALDLRDLSVRLTGAGQPERRLRAVYASGARTAEAEAEAYRRGCSCVYAVVVRANPAALLRIARRSEVRAVDPAPGVRRLDRAVFLPPLPEQWAARSAPIDGSSTSRRPRGVAGADAGGRDGSEFSTAQRSALGSWYRQGQHPCCSTGVEPGRPVPRTIGRRPDGVGGVV